MTYHSIQTFKLAVTLAISLGLGVSRVVPVQAAAAATRADHSAQVLESQGPEVKEPDSALDRILKLARPTYAVEPQRRGLGVQSGETQGQNLAATPSDSEQDDSDGGAFFSLAVLVALVILIVNLFSGRRAAGSTPAPEPEKPSTPQGGTGLTGGSSSGGGGGSGSGGNKPGEPVAVPTPALLPGLLGMGLQMLRKRKAQAELALESELSQP